MGLFQNKWHFSKYLKMETVKVGLDAIALAKSILSWVIFYCLYRIVSQLENSTFHSVLGYVAIVSWAVAILIHCLDMYAELRVCGMCKDGKSIYGDVIVHSILKALYSAPVLIIGIGEFNSDIKDWWSKNEILAVICGVLMQTVTVCLAYVRLHRLRKCGSVCAVELRGDELKNTIKLKVKGDKSIENVDLTKEDLIIGYEDDDIYIVPKDEAKMANYKVYEKEKVDYIKVKDRYIRFTGGSWKCVDGVAETIEEAEVDIEEKVKIKVESEETEWKRNVDKRLDLLEEDMKQVKSDVAEIKRLLYRSQAREVKHKPSRIKVRK